MNRDVRVTQAASGTTGVVASSNGCGGLLMTYMCHRVPVWATSYASKLRWVPRQVFRSYLFLFTVTVLSQSLN